MKMIISIILGTSLYVCLSPAMQSHEIQNMQDPQTIHEVGKKKSIMSALARKVEIERKEDVAASQLRTSQKKLKNPKKLNKTPSFEEYMEEQADLSTCLMNPKQIKLKYFPGTLLDM